MLTVHLHAPIHLKHDVPVVSVALCDLHEPHLVHGTASRRPAPDAGYLNSLDEQQLAYRC